MGSADLHEVCVRTAKEAKPNSPEAPDTCDASIPADRAVQSYQESILPATVRRRNVSKNEKIAAVDGAEDDYSSYSQDFQGDFHDECQFSLGNGQALAKGADLGASTSSDVTKNSVLFTKRRTCSQPSRTGTTSTASVGITPLWRQDSAIPKIPNTLRCIALLSIHDYANEEQTIDTIAEKEGKAIPPSSPLLEDQDGAKDKGAASPRDSDAKIKDVNMTSNISGSDRESDWEDIGNPISPTSKYRGTEVDEIRVDSDVETAHAKLVRGKTQTKEDFPICDEMSFPRIEIPYDGFPPELLDLKYDKRSRVPNYASRTLPHIQGFKSSEDESCDTPARENSFHDDRALLPSQHRALSNSAMNTNGARFSSL